MYEFMPIYKLWIHVLCSVIMDYSQPTCMYIFPSASKYSFEVMLIQTELISGKCYSSCSAIHQVIGMCT